MLLFAVLYWLDQVWFNKNIFTSLGFFPGGLALLQNDFFLYFGFFIEFIEVIDDDGDWKCNTENSTEGAAYEER